MSIILDTDTAADSPTATTGKADRLWRLPAMLAQPDLTSLILRIAVAVPFWKSGILKWEGFLDLAPIATLLFENEFMLHLPGGPYPYPFPTLAAWGAGLGEIILPVLIVLGLFTRYAALGLLAMTAIIQITVPTGWPLHLTWAAMALGVMLIGPKRLSVDFLIKRDR